MINRYNTFVLVLFIMFILPICSGAAEVEVITHKATIAGGVQRVDIIGGDYYYDPNYIIVHVNVPVELHVKKASGLIPHDIVIDEPEAGIVFKEKIKKEPKVIRFTPVKTGIFPFYCSKKPPFLKSHRDKGMEGIIEVIE